MIGLGAAAAVTAALVVWWTRRDPAGSSEPPLVLATAPVRAIEGRISYAAADVHRPYEVARGASAAGAGAGTGTRGVAGAIDNIPLDTLARLERRGDLHGIAAAHLLMSDVRDASRYLDRLAPDPDVVSDRALVLRSSGRLSDALIALDGVLRAVPRHPQALWNRALVLRELGLPLSAAAELEAVATLNEPGWSGEARALAKALSDEIAERRTAFLRLVADGRRLAAEPGAVTPEIARRFPGMTRLVFYDAVRSADSAAAVRALAPLAATLDAVYTGHVLASQVERVARADFARRAPLARRYAALAGGQRLDPAGATALLAALRAAGQDDLLYGAMVRVFRPQVPPAELPELRRLTGALHDPWFELLTVEQTAKAALAGGDLAGAEAVVLPALAGCERRSIDYRCALLEQVLGGIYLGSLRLPDTRRVVASGWQRARRTGEWYLELGFLQLLAGLESLQDDAAGSTLPLVRTYAAEPVRREPARCDLAVWRREALALALVSRDDLAAARRELAEADATEGACPPAEPSVAMLEVKAHVLRDSDGVTAHEVAELRAQIEALRAASGPAATTRAALDQIEGRLLIDRDRPAAIALLERAIAAVRSARADDVDAHRARSYAYSILILDAGRAGDWDRVWRLLGDDAGIAAAPRCALGAVVEDRRSLVVVRDPSGASHGVFDGTRAGPAVDPGSFVPAALRDALRGCPAIDVLARPPVQGLPGLLPVDLAWSYRSSAGPPGEAAPGTPRRVVIAGAEPPAALGLARLAPWRSTTAPDVVLDGPSATPSRALAAIADASFVEVHAHGMVQATVSDASFLMLSPEADGGYALTAGAIRKQPLRRHPIVVLAACHAATTASYRHEAWSLPAAFLAAGARAVIASTDVVSDADAGAFFDDLRARIERGAAPAVALHDTRAQWLAAHPSASWTRSLMVFQ